LCSTKELPGYLFRRLVPGNSRKVMHESNHGQTFALLWAIAGGIT
jgi:hypothetical protein